MADSIVTYTDPGCPHCRRLRQYLDGHGIPYRNRDVTADPEAVAELERMDAPGVPVTVVGGETIVGFNQDRLEEALRRHGVATGSPA